MKKLPAILITSGLVFFILGIILFILIFFPVISQEVSYEINKSKVTQELVPVDKEFGIVIPKIQANSKIIAQVDPYNSFVYQRALTKGVAQAKGTANPDENGNMFLFSHSSVNFYEARMYNSVFYLLSKLEKEDKIDVYFKDKKYSYKVTNKKLVNDTDVSYLTARSKTKTLTLMTCWPPGTSFKRLIVIAEPLQN